MDRIRVTITADIKPTEDREKVIRAILNLFPDAVFDEYERVIVGRTDSLERFKELIKEQRIRDTVRSYMLGHTYGGKNIVVFLNKEVAYIGRVNLAEEGELTMGEIRVDISCDDAALLIDYLTHH
ncbi:MAG: hypothetical protein DRN20_04155, partial [Thermoplasmata archaeon]